MIIGEEEGLVFADRPAERSAELILLERLGGRSEVVGGIENVVAEKLPEGAVDLVGAGTGDDVGGRPETVAEFGVGVMGEDAEFGTASTGGLRTKPPSTPLKLLAPSIRKLLDSGRWPFTA